MRQSVFVVAVVASLVVTSAQPAATSATVPLDASTNSTIVEFTIQKRDGTPRKARFLVDTGGRRRCRGFCRREISSARYQRVAAPTGPRQHPREAISGTPRRDPAAALNDR